VPPFCLIAVTLVSDDTAAVLNGWVDITDDQLDRLRAHGLM
jgi:hypothetical protein